MSTEVEQKVVQMKFDNAKFESGIRTTLSSLEKLKQSLKFDKVANSFSGITTAAKGVDLSAIGLSADAISVKFSAMEIFTIQAFSRISNAAITTGKNIVSSFTIEPIKMGFQEYETQINAVQTILANTKSKGSTLDDVNAALAELNTYADKTIYNFTEMTRNIGTFTAAGVGLETSVEAIKGIANLAAISGSTSQQASTAMYQLSQALSSGRVALQDWNSVVNAGMGGEIFQNALIETAELHGVNVRQMIAEEGSFRETLTKNAWLTSDVLTETLAKFTGDLTKEQLLAKGYTEEQANAIIDLGATANDAATKVKTFSQLMETLKEAAQSGWTQTWQLLVGDFEEAKKLYTTISDTLGAIIGASAEARNSMLQGWKDLGGRDKLIKGIGNLWESVYSIMTKVGEAFREVFPRTTSKELFSLTDTFEKLTAKLIPTENTLNAVKMAFKGLFQIVKVFTSVLTIPLKFIPALVDVLTALGSVVMKAVGFVGMLTNGFFDFITVGHGIDVVFSKIAEIIAIATGAVHDFITGMNTPMSINELKKAIPAFEKVCDATETAKQAVLTYAEAAVSAFKNIDKEAVKTTVVDTLSKVVNKAIDIYKVLKNEMSDALDFGKGVIDTAFGRLKDFVEWVDWQQVFEFFTGAVAAKFFLTLATTMKRLSKAFETVAKNKSLLSDISESISGAFDSVGDSLKSWQNSLRANNLMKIGLAIGVISASIFMLSRVEVDKMIPALAAVGSLFVAITASSVLLAKYADGAAIKGMMGMASGILILSVAVEKLAKLDTVKMGLGLAGVVALITTLGVFTGVMSKMKAQITTGSLVLIAFATSIMILTSAVLKLTKIGPAELAIAMSGIVALALSVAAASKILAKGSQDDAKASLKLMAFASSIKQLAKAVKILSEINLQDMIKGLAGVGTLMLTMGTFANKVRADKMISIGIGMNFLALALTGMTVPLAIMGNMKLDTLAVGLSSIAILMGSLSLALRGMPKNMPAIGLGLTMVASAMVVMSAAIAIVGNLQLDTLAKSIVTFGVALGGLSIALNSMTGTLGASAALLVASTALVALSAAIGLMGSMSLGAVAVGLIAFGGAMAILSAAAIALIPATGALAGMAVAMLGFTTSLLIGSVALGAFGVALVSLVAGLTAAAGMGTAFFKMIEGIVKTIAGLVPIIGRAAADLVVAFIEGLSKGKNALRRAFVDLILVSLEAVNEVVPAFVETMLNIIEKVFESLARHTEPIIKNVVRFIIGIIRGISAHLPELVTEAVNLVVTLFTSIADAISSISFEDLAKVIMGAGMMSGLMVILSAILPTIPSAAVTLAAMGGIVMEMIGILALMGGIAQIPGLKWLVDEGGDILGKVGKAIGKFAGGIVGGIADGIMSVLPSIGKHLSDFMSNAKPFFDGIKTIDEGSVKSIGYLAAATALLTATSFVDGIISFFRGGESTLVRFGKELADFAPYYKKYADTMAGTNGSELEKTSNAIKSIGEFVKMVPSQSGLSKLLLGEKDLVGFGKAICEFAPYFAKYSSAISGVNPEAVTASSAAAESLAVFAEKIPNAGGLAAAILGENSVAEFGKELAKFGPHLKKYADSVKGVDANVVTSSVNAATALATFADKIPNKGGLVALFTGDNSLSSLAKDLSKFGPSLKAYSDSVTGISISSIRASVSGATSLIELAKIIPTSKMRLSVLGDELEDFGKSIGKYYDRISDVNFNKISSSVSALNKLVDMCSNIEGVNVYGMQQFSDGLAKLSGSSITKFTDAFDGAHDKARTSVSNFITAAASGITAKNEVVKASANEMMNTILSSITLGAPQVTSAMTTLFMGLSTIVQNGSNTIRASVISLVDVLTLTIIHKTPAVSNAMSTLMNSILTTVNSKSTVMLTAGSLLTNNMAVGIRQGQANVINTITSVTTYALNKVRGFSGSFRSAGQSLISSLNSGMNSVSSNIASNITGILNRAKSAIVSYNSSFRLAGSTLMSNLSAGISAATSQVQSYSKTAASSSASAIRGYYWTWYDAGKYLVQGFANGISGYTYLATAKARNMAYAADQAARKQLGIHSPSRIGEEIGMFLVKGFAGGITKNMDESTKQSATMADRAKEALREALRNIPDLSDEDLNYNPVITPVLDLSEVHKSGRILDNMFSTDIAARASYGMSKRIDNGQVGNNSTTTVDNSIQNEFHIVTRENDDPTTVANNVSRIIQRQIERRETVWE